MTKAEVLRLVKKEIAAETGLSVSEIADTATFFELGLNSISAVFLLDILEKRLKVAMNPLFFWDYPTVDSFSDHITSLLQK